MKIKDVEIVVMSDEEYGEHLNQLIPSGVNVFLLLE